MTRITDTREHLVRTVTAEMVGPFDLDNPDAAEVLKLPPSRWYLTGYLAPELGREDDDPTADEEFGAGVVVILARGPSSGHVGFLEDWDDDRVKLLGGNQGNAVTKAWFPMSRVIGWRIPA